jgi:la-related protein 1
MGRDRARGQAFFRQALAEFSGEWRVFLEYAQYYLHQNEVRQAIVMINEGLKKHPGSGRLWAFRVQLDAFVGIKKQALTLRKAIEAVPKSGEVWCEAARMALNPLSKYFNLTAAKRYLEFAYRFTPQHGDSLIEMMRAEILEKGANANFQEIRKRFLCSEGNYGLLFVVIRKPTERPLTEVFEDSLREVQRDIARNKRAYARAIARSGFVLNSIAIEQDRLDQMVEVSPPSTFAFGMTNIGKMVLNPGLCTTHEERLSVVLGPSGLT